MSNIQEKILETQPYFREMNVVENVIYVSVIFPNGWGMDANVISEHFGVTVTNNPDNGPTGFFFWAPITTGFDNVFESVKFIIDMNEAAQRKMNLMNEKIAELKNIFINEDDVALLETLTFSFNKPTPKKKRGVKPKTVENMGEGITEGITEGINPETVITSTLETGDNGIIHPKELLNKEVTKNKKEKNNIGKIDHVTKNENVFSKEEIEELIGEKI